MENNKILIVLRGDNLRSLAGLFATDSSDIEIIRELTEEEIATLKPEDRTPERIWEAEMKKIITAIANYSPKRIIIIDKPNKDLRDLEKPISTAKLYGRDILIIENVYKPDRNLGTYIPNGENKGIFSTIKGWRKNKKVVS